MDDLSDDPPTIVQGYVGYKVPLWWDKGTLDDVVAWVATRRAQRAKDGDPVVCSIQRRREFTPCVSRRAAKF